MAKILAVEIDLEQASYIPECGLDVPFLVGQAGYYAHMLIGCSEQFSQRILEDLKQEATDG